MIKYIKSSNTSNYDCIYIRTAENDAKELTLTLALNCLDD